MDIMELGAIGELVGGVAVIASLVYVGLQVRQNTGMVKMSAMQSIVRGGVEHNNRIADNADLADMLVRAVEDSDSLSNVDQIRLSSHIVTLYHHLDAAFHMHRSGLLDAETWGKFAYEVPLWMNLPFIREWFEAEKLRLTPSFREYVQERLSEPTSLEVMPGFMREAAAIGTEGASPTPTDSGQEGR